MTDDMTSTPDKPVWKKWWFWVAAILILAAIGSMLPEDDAPVAADTTTTTAAETTTTEATTTTTGETTTTKPEVDWLAEMEACHDDGGCSSFPGVVSIKEVGNYLVADAHVDVALQVCNDLKGHLAWSGHVDVQDAFAGGVVARSRSAVGGCERR